MTGIERMEREKRERMARVVRNWLLRYSLEISIVSLPNLPLTSTFNEASITLLVEFGVHLSEGD